VAALAFIARGWREGARVMLATAIDP